MMRLFLFISGLLLCASAQAMEWKSDITLSPQPMTYSGPADSVMPGSIIGSTGAPPSAYNRCSGVGLFFTALKARWSRAAARSQAG